MIREAIEVVVSGDSLSMEAAAHAMNEIMSGEATPAQFGAFVTALRLKGETVDEIAGMAQVMRQHSLRVELDGTLVDTCGTGGDGSSTFNISTTAAFVAAGAGAKVAKHGNRAMSGSSGSADVLEALGANIALSPESVARCIKDTGFGFMFAQGFHPSMRFAAGPRREIGIRTVFNILGPLTNPAGAGAQVIGVADASMAAKMAQALSRLGSRRALVVHGNDGLDEITIADSTQVWELNEGAVSEYSVSPEDLGLGKSLLSEVQVSDTGGKRAHAARCSQRQRRRSAGHHDSQRRCRSTRRWAGGKPPRWRRRSRPVHRRRQRQVSNGGIHCAQPEFGLGSVDISIFQPVFPISPSFPHRRETSIIRTAKRRGVSQYCGAGLSFPVFTGTCFTGVTQVSTHSKYRRDFTSRRHWSSQAPARKGSQSATNTRLAKSTATIGKT